MRRMALTLVFGVVMLLLHAADAIAGGGENPPTLFATKTTGPAVSAVVVMDPHDPIFAPTFNLEDIPPTQKAKQASIWIQKGAAVAGATFRMPSTVQFTQSGCDATKTDQRFANKRLTTWIPQAIVTQLFASLGITISSTNVPVITDVDNAVCTPDPENPATTPGPGILSFQAVIQFEVPQN